MRITLLLIMFYLNLNAYDYNDVIGDYKAKKYKELCLKSSIFYKEDAKDENLLSIIGDACAKSDYINPLGYVVKRLISTPEFRKNASYFATLILQKKLIYQFMSDGISLKNLRLPRSDHTLSILFENLAKENYKKQGGTIIIKTKAVTYKVWITDESQKIVYVQEYVGNKKIKTHWYI